MSDQLRVMPAFSQGTIMALPDNLDANQVRNAAGVEVEFQHKAWPTATSREYAQVGEAYNLEHRLRIAHTEIGSGLDKRRRSLSQVRKQVVGVSGVTRQIIVNTSVEIPVGDLNSNDEVENVLAEAGSFMYLTGADATFLYAGTGSGCTALKDGSL